MTILHPQQGGLGKVIIANSGASYSIDPTLGTQFQITLTAPAPVITIDTSKLPLEGFSCVPITLVLIQDAIGGRVPDLSAFGYIFSTPPLMLLAPSAVCVYTLSPIVQGPPGFYLISGFQFNGFGNLEALPFYDSSTAIATSIKQNDNGAGQNHFEFISTTNKGFKFDKALLRKGGPDQSVGSTLIIDPTTIGGFKRLALTGDVDISFDLSNIPQTDWTTSFGLSIVQSNTGNNKISLTQAPGIANFVSNSFFSNILPCDLRANFPTMVNVTIEPTSTSGVFRARWDLVNQITPWVATVNTTNNTSANIFTFDVPVGTIRSFKGTVKGYQTGGTSGFVGDATSFCFEVSAKNVGGVITVARNLYALLTRGGFGINIIYTSGTTVAIQVNGDANANATWTMGAAEVV
jgi:hypothetical protein